MSDLCPICKELYYDTLTNAEMFESDSYIRVYGDLCIDGTIAYIHEQGDEDE